VCFVAIALMVHGAYASFVVSDAKTHHVNTSAMALTIGGGTPEDDEFSMDASDMVTGDLAARTFTLTTGGPAGDIVDVKLTSEATTSSLLDTDTSHGLVLIVAQCSVPWTQHTAGGHPVVDGCSGVQSFPVFFVPVIESDVSLTGLDLTPGTPNYLVIGMILAGSGGDDTALENQTSVIKFTFAGVQRAGEHK
jgi:hypothetical protein